MSGSSSATPNLAISGAVATPLSLTAATLASRFTPVTVTIGTGSSAVTYTGASIYSIISATAFQYPTSVKNGQLLDYLQVTAASGSQVVLSEGETDPSFGGANSTDIIAYQANGVAIAPTLIVPGDVNGGVGGRDLASVVDIHVATASVPAGAVSSLAAPPVTLSGALATPQSETEAQIQALGATVQNDTFLQGTTPKSYSFTGVPMLTVLQSAGVTSSIIDSYVVATGTDGYGVVYSGAEINPTTRTAPTAIVAYNDGAGTFPSVGGITNSLRTTAPFDSKGGRYVSNLDSLSIASGGASGAVPGLTPTLSGDNASTSAVLTALLGAITPAGSTAVTSVSPDGSAFAAPTSGTANIALASPPSTGGALLLPAGYQAEFLQGSDAATLIDAAVGNALLVGNQGNDVLAAFAGADTLVAGGGNDTLSGSAAGDFLIADSGVNTLLGGSASATIITQSSTNTVFLGSGSARVVSSGTDTIVGGGGSSTVFANAGGTVFSGGGGMLFANGSAASTVVGGSGSATLFAGAGGGVDVAGSGGNSILVGGAGAATVVGAASGDQVFASGAAADLLAAGTGNETLSGAGSTGADVYFAGGGNDVIVVGSGPSTIAGGTGAATIVAGSGRDVFAFANGAAGGTDAIFGFSGTTDIIALNGYAASVAGAVLAGARSVGGSTTLTLPDGTQIVLQGVASLGAGLVS